MTDLEAAVAFFVGLGLEIEGRMPISGDFLDTVTGLHGASTQIVMLRPPGGGTSLELSCFTRPTAVTDGAVVPVHHVGLRSAAFEVDDLDAVVSWAATQGYGLVGGIGAYEGIWRMAYVSGPDGIIVAIAERTDRA